MAAARLDKRVISRLIADELESIAPASGQPTIVVRHVGEPLDAGASDVVVRIVAIDFEQRPRSAGGDDQDTHEFVLTLEVFVGDAVTIDDRFELESVMSRVEAALTEQGTTDGAHTMHTNQSQSSLDAPDEHDVGRSGVIVIQGTASRVSGETTE